MYNETEIRRLLDRFMEGKTSLEEEQALASWFRSHSEVSDDLKDYQSMFSYFDEGMLFDEHGNTLFSEHEQSDEAPKKVDKPRLWWYVAASIAIILILGTGAYKFSSTKSYDTGECIVQDIPSQRDTTSAKKVEGNVILEKVNKTNYTKQFHKKQVPRRYHKHQFAPAPPQTLLAQETYTSPSDSSTFSDFEESLNLALTDADEVHAQWLGNIQQLNLEASQENMLIDTNLLNLIQEDLMANLLDLNSDDINEYEEISEEYE